MRTIFISYRRADSADAAGRLYDRLAEQFGDQNVFMDVDDIGPGEDYVVAIERRLANCDTMIVLIGPGWAAAPSPTGGRRLDDPHDLARLEVEVGLQRDVRVIPILLGDAEMPPAADLPEPLRPLLRRQAVRLSHATFHKDVDLLLERLGRKVRRRVTPRRWLWLAAGGVVAIAVVVTIYQVAGGRTSSGHLSETGDVGPAQTGEVDPRPVRQPESVAEQPPDPQPEPNAPPARREEPKPPVVRPTTTVFIAYAGDAYGCMPSVQLVIGGRQFALATNPFPVPGLKEGPNPFQLAGAVQCGTFGSCVAAGAGTIQVRNRATYNLVWQLVGYGQCSLTLLEAR